MSLILLEKQGDVWRSRVEGHFILGVHPIETLRKGLPEAMAQAVVDHCAMAGEDVEQFTAQFVREINALAPVNAKADAPEGWGRIVTPELIAQSTRAVDDFEAVPHALRVEPRRARVPRKAAVVAPEAEQAPVEPVAAPKEDI